MMITRSKKKKSENHNDQRRNKFDEIPLDLLIEIIGRFPVKSVAKSLLFSKSWARIIRSRDFITSYSFRSWSQPRLLVAFIDIDRQNERQDWYFFSPSSNSSSSSSSISRVTCPLPNPEREYYSQYLNGLLNLGYGRQQFVANPSTGKSITLPRAKIRTCVNDQLMRCFFGYDSVNDQYNVLCMRIPDRPGRKSPSSQHQVVTLGAKKSWRIIDRSIPHLPCSNGHVCIDGVVYYVAKTGNDLLQLSLMRFDLRSEKLDLFTSLHEDIKPRHLHDPMTLINYKGKVALPTKTSAYTFEVWIMDQYAETHAWLKKSFSIQDSNSLFQFDYLHIRGTSHSTGEFVLAPRYYFDEFNVIYYNPDTNSGRNIKVEVYGDYEFKRRGTRAIVFSDYIECVRLL